MRLAQLARKIGITQGEIVETLSNKGFKIEENGNTKLSQQELDLIFDHYNLDVQNDTSEKELATEDIEEDTSEAESEVIIEETEHVEDLPEPQTEDVVASQEYISVEAEDKTELQQPEPEVIRAKKVKLEGIKVVGKIDLPEPVEPKQTEESVKEKTKDIKPKRRRNERRKQRKKLSYSEKVKKEEQKAEREKKKKKRLIKEKKKKHYFEKVQPKVAAKPKKKASKKKFTSTAPKKVKPHYKNPIRKFWAWLNGEYDV